MREIKFRAWNGREFVNTGRLTLDDLENNQLLNFQQFAGLKDKNGKEIYEGDVVETDGKRRLVIFDESMWKIDKLVLSHWNNKLEIIGNIYENPELLKKEVCEHICTGNCRRNGCNCACGEFHEEKAAA